MKKEVGRPAGHGDNAAITHIRVSLSTKALIDRLKVEHGYQTSDQVLSNLLPQPSQVENNLQLPKQPTTRPTTEEPIITGPMRPSLQRSDINRINSVSKHYYQKYDAPKSKQQRHKAKSIGIRRSRKNKSW